MSDERGEVQTPSILFFESTIFTYIQIILIPIKINSIGIPNFKKVLFRYTPKKPTTKRKNITPMVTNL